MKSIDLIILCYNESENIIPLTNSIFSTFKKAKELKCNVLWVDNGSTDESLNIIKKLCKKNKKIKCLSLSRNFGQQAAIHSGLLNSSSDYVCFMDGDQQDPPSDAFKMYKKIKKEKADVVYAVRTKRNENLFKKMCFYLFYKIWQLFSDIKVSANAGEFSLITRQVANSILSSKEFHRFNRGLRAWAGFSQIPYYHERPRRKFGKDKSNFYQGLKLAVDGILSFSLKPIRFVFFAGIFLSLATLIIISLKFITIFFR